VHLILVRAVNVTVVNTVMQGVHSCTRSSYVPSMRLLLILLCREFINALDPRYAPYLPSRQTLSDKLVPELYDELRSDIETEMSASTCHAITVELWTNSR